MQTVVAPVLAVLFIAAAVFLAWTHDTYAASPERLDVVKTDPRVAYDDRGDVVVLRPTSRSDGHGLVFLAGAKVEPQAYASGLRELAAEGTTVVIVKPFLNLALLESRRLDAFTAHAPDIRTWAVGGHSMGGVRACGYASAPEVKQLLLFASYCSTHDLADRSDLDVLSVHGTRDGLIARESIEDSAVLMPERTRVVHVDGVTHAQFGSYGAQSGDGTPLISDDEAHERITALVLPFLGSQE
ncbi:MAG: alpha/beta hydrolase [Dietzia sp.]